MLPRLGRPHSSLALLLLASCHAGSQSVPMTGTADGGASRDAGDGTFETTSGTRLRQIRQRGYGVDALVGWQDTKLQTRCDWVREDDDLRCFPTDARGMMDLYADAACTQKVATYASTSCPPFAFVSDVVTQGCTSHRRLFGRGRALARGAPLYAGGPGQSCIQRLTVSDTLQAFTMGDPITDLPVAHLRTIPSAGRLAPRWAESEDGARYMFTFADNQTGAECTLDYAADGKIRCLPPVNAATVIDAYADKSCTVPLVAVASGCAKPTVVRHNLLDQCPHRNAVHAIGDTAASYASSGGMCMTWSVGTLATFAEGPEIPAESFEAGTELQSGAQRLRQYVHTNSAGTERLGLHDMELQVDCTGRVAADGSLRCLPVANPFFLVGEAAYFADAACTVPLAYTFESACVSPFVEGLDRNACPDRYHVYRRGAQNTGTVFTRVTLAGRSTCMTSESRAGFYAIGDEVPPDQFAPLTETIE